jgi:hypothetical protein
MLHQVLTELACADPGTDLDAIARRLDLGRDELDSMVDYWVRRGRLQRQELRSACPGGGCSRCPTGHRGSPGCGASAANPGNTVLIGITVKRSPSRR